MQPSSGSHIPDGLLAANALLSEKPRQGLPSWESAPHQGIGEANWTAAIGLRASHHPNRVQSRYTGKERDTESGLDYFGVRYYGSSMGRFMSPDDGSDWNPANPQSLNLYSYGHNNPLALVDPDGHRPIPAQSAHIANAIAQDRTLHAVFNAANNFSPSGFENAFNSGGLNSLSSPVGNTVRGLAGEAQLLGSEVGHQCFEYWHGGGSGNCNRRCHQQRRLRWQCHFNACSRCRSLGFALSGSASKLCQQDIRRRSVHSSAARPCGCSKAACAEHGR